MQSSKPHTGMAGSGTSLSMIAYKLGGLLVCLELVCSIYFIIIPFWYEEACRRAQDIHLDFIFIGSSRVAIAIDTDEFVKTIGSKTNRTVNAINLGRGYSTQMEHYLGLKKLVLTNSDALRGTIVFEEAPMGVPGLSKLNERWFHPDNPMLLANTMTIPDLWQFLFKSDADLKTKTEMTALKISRTFQVFGNGIPLLANARTVLQRKWFPARKTTALTAVGGILTDRASITTARKGAIEYVERELKTQSVLRPEDTEQWVLKKVIDFVSANGGRVILYRTPVSSVHQKPYTTTIGIKNNLFFKSVLIKWNIPLLDPVIATNDSDFPDFWHLRSSRSRELSSKLAQAYLDMPRQEHPPATTK